MVTLLLLALAHAPGDAVMLKHTFIKGIKSEYSVDANLQVEARGGELATFLPEELELKYTFFTNCLDVSNSIATVRYARPSITEIGGATPDSDPVPKTEKLDQVMTMQVSPINEVLDYKDLTPKKKKPAGDTTSELLFTNGSAAARQSVHDFILPFIEDLERLSVYAGPIEASVDLEPRLNLDAVKVGDTWKRTVGYQPQKLTNKAGKTVVQRLDLTYTYIGLVESRGKKVQRVHADLKLDTDLGKYVNDLFNAKPENTGLKSIPTKMTIGMDFDLDPTTLQTIYAAVKSEGSFKIFGTFSPGAAVEQNIRGTSVMKLVSNRNVLAASPKG
ncbi:MAG TPA: hypothetical protein VKT78_20435 [Fimbriimonadaceae bacterium]|nr:hypothetical protein [Fimbriimonadaceae bacterium]